MNDPEYQLLIDSFMSIKRAKLKFQLMRLVVELATQIPWKN